MPVTHPIPTEETDKERAHLRTALNYITLRSGLAEIVKHMSMADESTMPGDVWRYIVTDVLQKSWAFRTDSTIEKYALDKKEVIEKKPGESIFSRAL